MSIFDRIIWRITKTNFLNCPIERQHRITGEFQRREFWRGAKWERGRFIGSPADYRGQA